MTKKLMILREAARLFADKGYNETSTQEIAEAAHTATGTIFYHFETKQGILRHIYENMVSQYLEDIEGLVDSGDTGIEALKNILEFNFRFAEENRAEFTVVHRDVPSHIKYDKERIDMIRRNSEQSVEFFKRAIERGVADGSIKPETNAVDTARLIKAMLVGLVRMTRLNMMDFPDRKKVTIDFCIKALQN